MATAASCASAASTVGSGAGATTGSASSGSASSARPLSHSSSSTKDLGTQALVLHPFVLSSQQSGLVSADADTRLFHYHSTTVAAYELVGMTLAVDPLY